MTLVNSRRHVFNLAGPLALVLLIVASGGTVMAQQAFNFMAVGSLRSWFSNMGCEFEEARTGTQQDGMEWPAYYLYQDCEAAKGFWIGTSNFTDENNKLYDHKVVHIGPRLNGVGEFYPMRFEMISRIDPPQSLVDGDPSSAGKPVQIDAIDPALPADRELINEDNTAIGLHMTRKILAFSQGYHDNYFIYDYTFTNTGNTNSDPAIELPGKTLTGVYFFWQYRYAPCQESRGLFIDGTAWGINTMNDARGDGANPATTFFPGNRDNDIRAQYSWHGKVPSYTKYDNIGGSVWTPVTNAAIPFSDRSDTSGRLCAPQFIGIATIHADRSASDHSDDPGEPSTTSYRSSDDNLNQNHTNAQFLSGQMDQEYAWMAFGHMSPRHADKVGPSGNPSQGISDPTTSGGQSICNGYGPYDIGPGDSVHIVMVEAVAGLSREKAISVGARFKDGNKYNPPLPDGITAAAKNDSVYSGRDSLFATFRRAIANFQGGYNIPRAPNPPRTFNVTGLGDRISLTWDVYGGGPTITGFRIYRAVGRYDGIYQQITPIDLPSTARSFDDTSLVRGTDYYYYILSIGDPADNNGNGLTPAGVALTGNRIYSQTYDPTQLKRKPGTDMSKIRIVPNPFSIGAYYRVDDPYSLRFPGAKDRIAFFNIPAKCTIKIYTEIGELIATINHTNNTGDEYWNSITSSNQVVVSGVYIVVFEDAATGVKTIQKLIVIR